MSIFLVSALNCMGTSATLAAAMVVALDGWHRRSVVHIVYAPAVHLASALLVGAGMVASLLRCLMGDAQMWVGVHCDGAVE